VTRQVAASLTPSRGVEWVVYSKRPFGGPEAVLAYLSRYTHRVAISNSRLLACDGAGVAFKYKDYRVDGHARQKVMRLATDEFIRRFLIHVLPTARLGWTASLRQQNLAAKGRDDVPDGILFQDAATKAEANAFGEEWKRYGCGLAIVESKRWQRPLDRQSGRRGEETAPSTQMLRYPAGWKTSRPANSVGAC
jgi:Putative transposase